MDIQAEMKVIDGYLNASTQMSINAVETAYWDLERRIDWVTKSLHKTLAARILVKRVIPELTDEEEKTAALVSYDMLGMTIENVKAQRRRLQIVLSN
jgi:hypothetical protein